MSLPFDIKVGGRFVRIARLRNEYYEFLPSPEATIKEELKKVRADLFSFLPQFHKIEPDRSFYSEPDPIAIIPLTTYEHWWKHQISDKTRNMARKAGKKGVTVSVVPFTDDFVKGIMGINNESPVRQGRPYWHYQEDFETVKKENITFLEQCRFIGAYLDSELIGYIKLVLGDQKASIMQILSKIGHRDKAPNNALMAKVVEICCELKIPRLHYASWSRRGLGEFKISHGFQKVDLPRYYIPLSLRGALALKFRLHRNPMAYIPPKWVDQYADLRAKWYDFKYGNARNSSAEAGVKQTALNPALVNREQ